MLIEQKSSYVDLSVKLKQSDGAMLTSYQQARRYAATYQKRIGGSIQTGEIVGVLYDKILREYKNPDNPESQRAHVHCVIVGFSSGTESETVKLFDNK